MAGDSKKGAGSTGSGGRETSVAVVRKAAAVLDALAVTQMTPAELASEIKEPRSSVYRLLSTLEDLEYIEPGVKRGSYRLGVKLLRMGDAVRAGIDERQAALPVMQEIHDATSETVFLCVRREDWAVCIERLDGLHVQSLVLKLGGMLPLHAGAASRALLAPESEDEWEAYFKRNEPLRPFSPYTPVTRDDVFASLRTVRDKGVAVSDEDVTLGIAALGAPVFDDRGRVAAALSISGVRESILGEGSRARELITEGARRVSALMGYRENEH